METLEKLSQKFHTGSLEHLEAQAEIPVLTGAQRQGDVSWWPMRAGQVAGLEQVKPEGYPVVKGEAGGNTHLLLAEGEVLFAPSSQGGVRLGTLVVKEGSVAHLHHPEHGYNSIGSGTYLFNGQRTQMDEIRRVAD